MLQVRPILFGLLVGLFVTFFATWAMFGALVVGGLG